MARRTTRIVVFLIAPEPHTDEPRRPMNVPSRVVALFALAFLLACSLHPRTTAPSQVVFFDDFTGDSLDRTRWNVRITGRTVNEEQQAYVDDTATIRVVKGPLAGGADGALLIRGRWREGHVTPEGRRHDFVSGRMDSRGKVEFMYGTAAARMRLPAGAGSGPRSGSSARDAGRTSARST